MNPDNTIIYRKAISEDMPHIMSITGRSEKWVSSALPYTYVACTPTVIGPSPTVIGPSPTVIGCCCIAPYYNTTGLTQYTYDDVKGKAVSLLAELSVADEYRRQSIGTNILNFAIARAKSPHIIAQVRVSNEAMEFHKKNGFELIFIKNNYYSDGETAAYLVKEYN
jgi:GNAT superfamily N-acetyltransferase